MTKLLACRACLSVDVKLHDITQTLAKEFETATGISVLNDADYLPYLCTYCCKRTHICVGFRRQCLTAQQTLVELCSANDKLTKEILKSSDVKGISQSLARSVTEHVDYTPSKSREPSPPFSGDGLDIKTEYPLSNDPLNHVTVTYDQSEDEELTTYTENREYDYVYCEPQPNAALSIKAEPAKPKRRSRKVAKPRKIDKNTTTPTDAGTPDASANTELPVKKKKFQCDICGKFWTSSHALAKHRRIHTGEKPYKCQQCDKSFSVKIILKIHMRVHTGEKPFKCEICAKTFSQQTHINAHRRTHTGEKPYKCETCQKTFSYSTHLVTHRRIHTGEKPYNCDICAKSFSTQGSLISHKRAHTGEKPYKCEACSKCFSSSSSYCRHKRRHCTVQVSSARKSV